MRSLLLLSNLERGEVGFRFYTVCGQRFSRHIVINQERVIGMPEPRRTCGRVTHIPSPDLSRADQAATASNIARFLSIRTIHLHLSFTGIPSLNLDCFIYFCI